MNFWLKMVIDTLHPFRCESGRRLHEHGIIAIVMILTYCAMVFLQLPVPEHFRELVAFIIGLLFGKHHKR